MKIGIGNIDLRNIRSDFDWDSWWRRWRRYWLSLISATVENTAPTNVVLTWASGKPSLLATDLTGTVNGIARAITSASWLGGVWTVVFASAVVYGDVVVLTFVKTGQTANVTNNIAAEAELTTYIAGFDLTDSQKKDLNDFILGIKEDLIINALSEAFDRIQIDGVDVAELGVKNLVSDNFHGILQGTPAPTHIASEGYDGDGSHSYIDQNYDPSINGVNFTLNSASLGVYVREDVNAAQVDIGFRRASNQRRCLINSRVTNLAQFYINTADVANGNVSNTDSRGMFIASRTASNLQTGQINGLIVVRYTINSDAVPDCNAVELALNTNNTISAYSTRQIGLTFIGKGFTPQEGALITKRVVKYFKSRNKSVVNYYVSFISPLIPDEQGYCTDGINHYTVGSTNMVKRNNDSTWSMIIQNTNLVAGILVTHCGGASYYDGKIYIAGCNNTDEENITSQSILIFDANDLSRLAVVDISAEGGYTSGCMVVPEDGESGIIYVVDFDTTSGTNYIKKYDLVTFAYLGNISLSSAIKGLQGITYKNNFFYASNHDDSGSPVINTVYKISKDGSVITTLFISNATEFEDIDFTQNQLRLQSIFGTTVAFVNYLENT